MIKVGFYTATPGLCDESVIFSYKSPMRPDDTNRKYGDFYKKCSKFGIDLKCIQNTDDLNWAEIILVADVAPKFDMLSRDIIRSNKPKILILEECEVIRPDLWEKKLWDKFDHILTWRDSLVDDQKFYKVNFSETRIPVRGNSFNNRKFSTMISSNKHIRHPLELYSERRAIINWYTKNNIDLFDLYGFDWDLKAFPLYGSILSILNGKKFKFLRKFLGNPPKSWQGVIEAKKNIYTKYKFAFSFENAKGIDGYVLEKIFDPMFAGCIPVYFGAPNIQDHVPSNCFIDYRDFKNIHDLHTYLQSIKKSDFINYQNNARKFLTSKKSYIFSTEYFCNVLLSSIMKLNSKNI